MYLAKPQQRPVHVVADLQSLVHRVGAPHRMFRVGVLSRRVDERAPAKSGTVALGADRLGNGPGHIGYVAGRLPTSR
ncbi:MAG TPA: hypothetical protein VHZ03_26805 [Trebonia sp.]|nr:hypothetical protein [Trebonia sp.]